MKLIRMTLRTALRALRRNKMRSGLTMLGIVIGVAAVIAMVSIGRGADAAVQKQIQSLGNNMLMVVPGATTAAPASSSSRERNWKLVSSVRPERTSFPIERISAFMAPIVRVRVDGRHACAGCYGPARTTTLSFTRTLPPCAR